MKPHPYLASDYAHERVGLELCCETDWPDVREGDCPKCVHCGEEFEYSAEDPTPCIERIAAEVERVWAAALRTT